jgi:hypothetical protein
MEGFDPKRYHVVNEYISRGVEGTIGNDHICFNLQTKKGLRQGDLLSPIMFNIVAYMLDILIN